MIDRFLKAKHWQLFLLTFGIPIIFQVIIMGSIILNLTSQSNPDPMVMFNYFKLFPILILLFAAVFYGWFWSVAIGLQSKVPDNVKMKVKKFKIFFFIPLIYIFTFMTFFGILLNEMMTIGPNLEPDMTNIIWIFAVIIPLHLFSIFCSFYSLYFVAKTFKTVELQREVKFEDFAGDFFLLWFYPIGIWFIQPKINKMMEN